MQEFHHPMSLVKCTRIKMLTPVVIFIGFMFTFSSATAQDTPPNEIQLLRAQLDAILEKLDELENAQENTANKQNELTSKMDDQQTQMEQGRERIRDSVSLNGFFDTEYLDTDNADVGSFTQHHLTLMLDSRTDDDKWHFSTEIEFEYGTQFEIEGDNVDGAGEINIERAWLQYTVGNRLKFRMGKFLLPQYSNIHHESNVTNSTLRPLFWQDNGGRIFGESLTGIAVLGDLTVSEKLGLSYNIHTGNGRSEQPSKEDANENKALGARITLHNRYWDGFFDKFDISTSVHTGDNAQGLSATRIDFELQASTNKFDFLGEYATADYHNGLGVEAEAEGYYAELAYRFASRWAVFYRFDELDITDVETSPHDAHQNLFGFRYKPQPNIALKAEIYRHEPDDSTIEDFNGVAFSAAYFF